MENRTSSRCSMSQSPSKYQFFKSKGGKIQRPGTVGRNPYLNFLREFRKRNCGLSAVETVRRGAKEWKSLPKDKKLQYIEAAFHAPKRQKQSEPEDAGCCPAACPKKPRKAACPKKRKSKCGRARKPKRARRGGCKRKRRPARRRRSC